MALEVAEELDDLWTLDAAGMDLEIKTQKSQTANDREALPIEGLLEQWRLPSGSPRPHPCGARAQPAFIDKDNEPSLTVGFFLMVGHGLRFH